jgi:hypothetical protein
MQHDGGAGSNTMPAAVPPVLLYITVILPSTARRSFARTQRKDQHIASNLDFFTALAKVVRQMKPADVGLDDPMQKAIAGLTCAA